jgi:peptidoglycan-associated lipoprotein
MFPDLMSFRGHRVLAVGAGVAVLVLAGCASSTRVEPPAPVENRLAPVASTGGVSGGSTAGTAGAGNSAVTPVTLDRKGDDGAGAGRVVYFDFDSYVVKDEYRPVVEAQARRLAADRKRRILVEGHTDERGGREYNLALGQKRAEAVVRSLVLLGTQEGQLEAVSFGKERPAVSGSNEEAWAKNRRAELKDR